MIYYLGYAKHLYTIGRHLKFWGETLRQHVAPHSYEQFAKAVRLPPGIYVFSDVERLTGEMTQNVTRRWNALERSEQPSVLLNHPARSMRRYELLRTLFESGVNSFDAYRLTEARWPRRYPVFLRPELHVMATKDGTLPLLEDQCALQDAIESLNTRGISRDDWLVVEFCDTSDANGIHRKYSAFRIGDRIVPRHINYARNWFVKSPDPGLDDTMGVDEEWAYLNDNPHAAELMDIFQAANIQYGRIDYALLDGRIQVWEINTNPNMGPLEEKPRADSPRWPVQSKFASEYEKALLALGGGDGSDMRRHGFKAANQGS